MKVYATEASRNLAVIGHGDAGKTQLISSLLYVAGATPRWGKVDEGTTVTDHDEDSIARKITLNTALAHLEHKETKVNLIDTPGYAAFVSHARPACRVADCGVVVVDGVKGVEVQTEKVWNYSNEFMLPRMMVVTKLDKEDSNVLPNIGAAIANSKLCPVFAVSTINLVGLSTLLDHIIEFAPDPAHHETEHGKNEKGEDESRKYSTSESFSAYCFRTIADPFAGRINVFKLMSGKVGTDANVYNSSRSTAERLGALHPTPG